MWSAVAAHGAGGDDHEDVVALGLGLELGGVAPGVLEPVIDNLAKGGVEDGGVGELGVAPASVEARAVDALVGGEGGLGGNSSASHGGGHSAAGNHFPASQFCHG